MSVDSEVGVVADGFRRAQRARVVFPVASVWTKSQEPFASGLAVQTDPSSSTISASSECFRGLYKATRSLFSRLSSLSLSAPSEARSLSSLVNSTMSSNPRCRLTPKMPGHRFANRGPATGPAIRDAGNTSSTGCDRPSSDTFWSCSSSLGRKTFCMTFVLPISLGAGYPRKYMVLLRRSRYGRRRVADRGARTLSIEKVVSLSSESEAESSSSCVAGVGGRSSWASRRPTAGDASRGM